MLTEEQKKSAERLTRYIERERLVSVMNDTKWRRLLEALAPIQGVLEFRRKEVGQDESQLESWNSDIYYMMAGWRSIEWLDISAQRSFRRGVLLAPEINDQTSLLLQTVRVADVPFSRQEYGIRIWGYLRPGVTPDWVK